MFWNLLCEKNNLQMQINDFEDEDSINDLQKIIGSFKFKNKPSKSGFCKYCGSYKLICWGGYGRNVRHMYAKGERVRAMRFSSWGQGVENPPVFKQGMNRTP